MKDEPDYMKATRKLAWEFGNEAQKRLLESYHPEMKELRTGPSNQEPPADTID